MALATGPDPHPSLRDAVLEALRARIVDGRLAPGDRLVERTLAEELGVSRVPVREALRTLEHEGFVEERPRRGMLVRSLSPADVEALFEVRDALESLVCRRLVARLDAEGLAGLRGIVERSDAALACGDHRTAVEANAAFHAALVQLCDSEIIRAVIEPVESRMGWLLSQHTDPAAMNAEHRSILEALAVRDADLAAERCRQHVQTSRAAAAAVVGAGTPTR